ncbi:DUF2927 domain-containing protein [Actibacterium sp. XHP0104]|uniref:DUF2927 domain-containing protein n=1 Tax=Actibacterium sp. XHP0104 TaxID=2984335 RepID=UPI0039915782
MRKLALTLCLGALAACGTAPVQSSAPALDLPPMKRFAAPAVTAPQRPNAQIANDFLSLAFEMESGRRLDMMTRFEGPIRVRVVPGAPSTLAPDLAALLHRLRREAGINITQVQGDEPAQITIQALPHASIQRLVPQAACFVVPGVSSWTDYQRHRRGDRVNWAALTRRDTAAIFLPSDVSPQEIRDCLHEELAQALGPLNDLYSLPDSVFNDDNFHTVLTGFDMLILRAYYAPEMTNGLTRDQAAARLPRVLARLNPRGQRAGGGSTPNTTPRAWIDAIETAYGPNTSNSRRRFEAARAVSIARNAGWQDTRLGFALFAQGRLMLAQDPALALASFLEARSIYTASSLTRVQDAHVSLHLAAFALSGGHADKALSLINSALPAATQAQNAALMASMLMVKAEALDAMNRPAEARAVRLDSLGWARYGFGSDKEVRARLNEIAALAPRRQQQ